MNSTLAEVFFKAYAGNGNIRYLPFSAPLAVLKHSEKEDFLALRIESVANLGAYMAGAGGGLQTYQYIHLQGSVYRLPAIALRVGAAPA